MRKALLLSAGIILAVPWAAASGGPYVIDQTGYGPGNREIVKMDSSYQSVTPIGNGPHNVAAIEFSADGFIYGVNSDSDTLEKIDPSTGVSSTVGLLGVDIIYEVDLDEDESGQLWMLVGNGLYLLDRNTGAASLDCEPSDYTVGLASLAGTRWTSSNSLVPPGAGCGLEYINQSGDPFGNLERGPDGWIHGINGTCAGWACMTSFYRVHPASGVVENLANYGDLYGVGGLTFDPNEQPSHEVPTLDWSGVALLISILTAAGIWFLSRRA